MQDRNQGSNNHSSSGHETVQAADQEERANNNAPFSIVYPRDVPPAIWALYAQAAEQLQQALNSYPDDDSNEQYIRRRRYEESLLRRIHANDNQSPADFDPDFSPYYWPTRPQPFQPTVVTKRPLTPLQNFMLAVRRNNRDAIEQYINEHTQEEYFHVTLREAAYVAQQVNNDALYGALMALAVDHEESHPNTNAAQADEIVVLNRSEQRLKQCNFTGTVPQSLCCSAMLLIMEDPVTICSGHTLDRSSLKECSTCPRTRMPILKDELNNGTDICLNSYIEAFINGSGKIDLHDIKKLLQCPLKKELFRDPVTLTCGLTVERKAAERLFADNDYQSVEICHDEKQFIIKRLDLRRAANIAIKTLVEEYLLAKKKKQDAINEQVRFARISIFTKVTDSSEADESSRPRPKY